MAAKLRDLRLDRHERIIGCLLRDILELRALQLEHRAATKRLVASHPEQQRVQARKAILVPRVGRLETVNPGLGHRIEARPRDRIGNRRDDRVFRRHPSTLHALGPVNLETESSDAQDAGGGTRTPDTRIMIPLL